MYELYLLYGLLHSKMRPHRNDHPGTAVILRGSNGKRGATIQPGNVYTDSRWGNLGPGGPPTNWLGTLRDDVLVLRSIMVQAKRGAITQSGDVLHRYPAGKPGTRRTTELLAENPERRRRSVSIHRRLHGALLTSVWS